MGRHCCFALCNSDSRAGLPGCDPKVKFYRFPQPCLLLRDNVLTWTNAEEANHIKRCEKCQIVQRWMLRCKRSDAKFQRVRQISPYVYVCSNHFEEKPIKMDYAKYLPRNSKSSVSYPKRRRRAVLESIKVETIQTNRVESDGTGNVEDGEAASTTERATLTNNIGEESIELPVIDPHTPSPTSCDSVLVKAKSVGTQTTTSFIDIDGLNSEIEHLQKEIQDLKDKLSDTVKSNASGQFLFV